MHVENPKGTYQVTHQRAQGSSEHVTWQQHTSVTAISQMVIYN